MQEAYDLLAMTAPYMVYILPAVFVFSFMAFADLILEFALNIVAEIKAKMRMS